MMKVLVVWMSCVVAVKVKPSTTQIQVVGQTENNNNSSNIVDTDEQASKLERISTRIIKTHPDWYDPNDSADHSHNAVTEQISPSSKFRDIENASNNLVDAVSNVRRSVFRRCHTSDAVENRLNEANTTSKYLRFRITLFTVGVGLIVALTCIVISWLIGAGTLVESQVGNRAYYNCGILWSAVFLMLGIMPTDAMLIRSLIVLVIVVMTLVAITYSKTAIDAYNGTLEFSISEDDNVMVPVCGDEIAQSGCTTCICRWTLNVLNIIACACYLLPALATTGDTKIYDFSAQKGFRYHDTAFKMADRQALQRLWASGRAMFFGFGSIVTVTTLIYKAIEDDVLWYGNDDLQAELILGLNCIALPAVMTSNRRGKIMAFLTALNAEEEAMCAASIAALLGGRDAGVCLQLARDGFRSISFDKLKEDDFSNNQEAANETNHLFGMTDETRLGKCDAFISHSWSDNGKEKFRVLETWCTKFKNEHNREPKLWFDKACINQKNIANDLLSLPIFLSGCEELLIIAGPSYTTRLWCIIEVFVFLKMGGSTDRITLVPIDFDEEQDLKTLFDNVDVSKSKCHKQSDRQKLLGIVQTGFGNNNQFNSIVRNVFQDRVMASLKSGIVESLKRTSVSSYKIAPAGES